MRARPARPRCVVLNLRLRSAAVRRLGLDGHVCELQLGLRRLAELAVRETASRCSVASACGPANSTANREHEAESRQRRSSRFQRAEPPPRTNSPRRRFCTPPRQRAPRSRPPPSLPSSDGTRRIRRSKPRAGQSRREPCRIPDDASAHTTLEYRHSESRHGESHCGELIAKIPPPFPAHFACLPPLLLASFRLAPMLV